MFSEKKIIHGFLSLKLCEKIKNVFVFWTNDIDLIFIGIDPTKSPGASSNILCFAVREILH